MGVPRGRRTKSKQGNRRSHLRMKKAGLVICQKCGAKNLSYSICSNCGVYKGRQVVDVMAKLSKREKKEKEKEMASTQKSS